MPSAPVVPGESHVEAEAGFLDPGRSGGERTERARPRSVTMDTLKEQACRVADDAWGRVERRYLQLERPLHDGAVAVPLQLPSRGKRLGLGRCASLRKSSASACLRSWMSTVHEYIEPTSRTAAAFNGTPGIPATGSHPGEFFVLRRRRGPPKRLAPVGAPRGDRRMANSVNERPRVPLPSSRDVHHGAVHRLHFRRIEHRDAAGEKAKKRSVRSSAGLGDDVGPPRRTTSADDRMRPESRRRKAGRATHRKPRRGGDSVPTPR